MDRTKLADEIRGAGRALRFADGPVMGFSFKSKSIRAHHSPRNKIKTSDWDIIRMAATCSQCDAAASATDIEFTEEWADCYQSFARMIWPIIDHDPDCEAEPYLPVSDAATKEFLKAKKRFEAERHAREATKTLKAKKTGSQEEKKSEGPAPLRAKPKAARKTLQKKKRPAPKKASLKKTAKRAKKKSVKGKKQ